MIPYLDKTIVKLGLVTALIVGLVAFYKWHYSQVFDAGINHQIAIQAKANEKVEETYTKEIGKALDERKTEKLESARLLQELSKVKGKYREIQEAATNSKCKSLGADSFELWNQIIGTAPNYQG